MKYLYTVISFLFMLGATTSCYREIDLDPGNDDQGQSLLVLNSIVTPDSLISAVATRTYFFASHHTERDYVEGLSISFFINGQQRGTLKYDDQSRLYVAPVRPEEGDVVTLRTDYQGQQVEVTDTVPHHVKIDTVRVEKMGPMHVYTDADYIYTYHIDFTDPSEGEHYYFLQYDVPERQQIYLMGVRDFTHEYVFQQLADEVNRYIPGWKAYSPDGLPFSDRGIHGQHHTLVVREIQQGDGPQLQYSTIHRQIRLYAISKAYYQYLFSILCNSTDGSGLHGGMIDLGIVDPMKIHSNVDGGTGIMGCYAVDRVNLSFER